MKHSFLKNKFMLIIFSQLNYYLEKRDFLNVYVAAEAVATLLHPKRFRGPLWVQETTQKLYMRNLSSISLGFAGLFTFWCSEEAAGRNLVSHGDIDAQQEKVPVDVSPFGQLFNRACHLLRQNQQQKGDAYQEVVAVHLNIRCSLLEAMCGSKLIIIRQRQVSERDPEQAKKTREAPKLRQYVCLISVDSA